MISVQEFYNKVHDKSDGKFADTPGPGHAKGAPKATPKQAAALKKVLSKPKTKAGSVIVADKKASVSDLKAAVAKKIADKKLASTPPKPKVEAKPLAPLKHLTTDQVLHTAVSKLSKEHISADVLDRLKFVGYEHHGPEKGRENGFLVHVQSGNSIDYAPGMSMADAAAKVSKVGKAKASTKDTAEEQRIAKVMTTRKSRVSSSSVAHLDDIGSGKALGMNEIPPPKGIAKTKLTDDDIAVLGEYRGTVYKEINGALRSGKPGSKGISAIVADLDSAFSRAGRTTEDVVVYRGTEKKMSKSFLDKGFTSTTYEHASAADFGEVISIRIPKGTRVLKLSGSSNEGHPGGESEILLPRNSTFTIQADGSYVVKTTE